MSTQAGPPGLGRAELLRKCVHVLVSITAAATIWILPALTGRVVLATALGIALLTEILRRNSRTLQDRFLHSFGPLLRPHEARTITGATTLALGFLIAGLAFEPRFAAAGILYAGVGDSASAVVGRAWGRRRYGPGKSLEGSLAFLGAAFAAGCVAPGIDVPAAAAAALTCTVFEALPLPVDDNLVLPLVAAAATWTAVALLG